MSTIGRWQEVNVDERNIAETKQQVAYFQALQIYFTAQKHLFDFIMQCLCRY